jgi:RimJ/RimL family protein N-acetyltransferase
LDVGDEFRHLGLMSDPAKAPDLATERLILHGHGLKDFADSAAMWADRDVVRFIGGRPFTEEEVWTRLLRYVGHWATMGYGFWAIREKATGRFVGEVGFADFRRELDPPFGDVPEMGWALSSWAHGKGYASEAIAAALAWGEQRFGRGARTVCMISPDNAPSIKAAEKAGYREFARTTYKGSPTVLFERV